MNNIRAIDSRNSSRRRNERRNGCRRVIKYDFGCNQWLKAVQSSYILWPKQDRRIDERRSLNRRFAERRVERLQYRHSTRRQKVSKQYSQQPMLTAEEKKMLNDLNHR